MCSQSLRDLLPLVRSPSHYLGTEINSARKDPAAVRLRVALAFPDLYEVGMSHIGIQVLYQILNARPHIAAERVFAPGKDLEARLRCHGVPLCSLEAATPIAEFDIIGFSLLYELNFTNVLNMLSLAGLPLYSRDRGESHPFVIAGGPCTFNPEPVADFFDAMVVGDGEDVIIGLADAWLAWKGSGADRQALLKAWSGIGGVYVPSFFSAGIDSNGFQVLTPLFSDYRAVRKALVADINKVPLPARPVVAFGRPIHDRLSLEVCRGCTRGCRFCQAGIIYRPVRERSPGNALSLARQALAGTGYDEVSLLSLSTGDYSAIDFLVERLMNRLAPDRIALSLPSLRVGSLTSGLMEQIRRVRKTGFTVAPEAGSERLRRMINKNVTEQDLEETVCKAFELGWGLIKLYFMIGLPGETGEDLEAIVALAERLQRACRRGGRKGEITVSVSSFIPKAHTPFQWMPQVSLEEGRARIDMLKGRLKCRRIRLKWHNPEMSLLEGLFARGDRRLSGLLVAAHREGCRFDGWSDHFDYGKWLKAIETCGVDVDRYTTRARDLSEPLPWDHIDSGVSMRFMEDELKKALEGRKTEDCRGGECNQCGVCDFQVVRPVTFYDDHADKGPQPADSPDRAGQAAYTKLLVSYAKRDQARYFGHLEMTKIFSRAFRRAGVKVRFSDGFHPAPRFSFENALAVGTESEEERFTIEVPLGVTPQGVLDRVNKELPAGLRLTACRPFNRMSPGPAQKTARYSIALTQGRFSEGRLKAFLDAKELPLTKKNIKGRSRTVDLRLVVKSVRLVSPARVDLVLDGQGGHGIRPADILAHVFGLSDDEVNLAEIVKRAGD